MSYLLSVNGIIWGAMLLLIGNFLSAYTGLLLVKASTYVGQSRIEDIAGTLYGKRAAQFCSWMYIFGLTGFVMAFMVYANEMLPAIMSVLFPGALPSFMVEK